MVQVADLTAQKFGALTVQSRAEQGANGKAHWRCLCDCGASVVARGDNLKHGRTRSCGQCGLGGQYGVLARADIPMSYRILIYDGPDMFKDRPYSFGIVLDANGKRVAKTSEPIARVPMKHEGHAVASRCMKILQAMEKINPQNNRTWRRWLTEERVVAETAGSFSTTAEVDEKWEEVTGQILPKDTGGLAPIQQPRRSTGPVEPTPPGLAALLKEWENE